MVQGTVFVYVCYVLTEGTVLKYNPSLPSIKGQWINVQVFTVCTGYPMRRTPVIHSIPFHSSPQSSEQKEREGGRWRGRRMKRESCSQARETKPYLKHRHTTSSYHLGKSFTKNFIFFFKIFICPNISLGQDNCVDNFNIILLNTLRYS